MRASRELRATSEISTPFPGGRTRVDTHKGRKRISRRWAQENR
jgi:hypothetical protein